jgi:rhodanese-related sulfurtransferase
MYTITPAQLWAKKQSAPIALIDVRGPAEYAVLHAEGAQNIPLDRIDAAAVAHLDAHRPLYVICKSGARSQIAIHRLYQLGFRQLYNVVGGTEAWAAGGLPTGRVHAVMR